MVELSLPALLRMARASIASAIRRDLDAAGFGDLPPNGPFVLSAVARTGTPFAEVIKALGVSKQTAGVLADALVARGYLDRHVDDQDRRRLRVLLTDHGTAAAAVVRASVRRVESRLLSDVGRDAIDQAKIVLVAVALMGTTQ